MADVKPIVLLADSQLLFWKDGERPFLKSVTGWLEGTPVRAAYLGACNGDLPEFYDLFVGAMSQVGVEDCRMIPATPSDEDLEFLRSASLVLIAGGSPRRGWEAFKRTELRAIVRERYESGAVLVGISAGAMLLGKRAWDEPGPSDDNLFGTFKLVPFVVSVHETGDWPQLREAVRLSDVGTSGIGLLAGGGAIYHPDHTLQPIRHSVEEIWREDEERLRHGVLMPGVAEELPEPEILELN
jgi:peptidase E